MGIAPLTLKPNYWEEFEILDSDLEFLYNHLLDNEIPLTPDELVAVLVNERIQKEREALTSSSQKLGAIYYPKDEYSVGQALQFPHLNWKRGVVKSIRDGHNPEVEGLKVIEVALDSGETHQFASGLAEHKLNSPISINLDDPNLDSQHILEVYGIRLTRVLSDHLEANPDLVRIAGRWFPRALLVDINVGHMNLAEAILEMEDGGPLTTRALMEQLDLPTDVNPKLTEFSLNLALQEDGRFDEVGPAGKILWFLKRMEPENVQNPPVHLRYNPVNYSPELVQPLLDEFEGNVADELENCLAPTPNGNEVSLTILYPHFRAGTLPICDKLIRFFPTAYESPRVQFVFVDADTGEKFSGWVIRENHYAIGLRDWFVKNEIIPGSVITIKKSNVPGEVIVKSGKKKPVRDWVRTAMIGSDGGIVFALLKHAVSTPISERMAIVISDPDALDKIWDQGGKQRGNLTNTVKTTMRELAKLSPQGHVNAQELYAAVNVVRRCPPGPILSILLESSWATHLGDLYFRIDDDNATEG